MASRFQRFFLPGFAFKAVVIGGGYAPRRALEKTHAGEAFTVDFEVGSSPFGLSALGTALFQRVSLPMTATLVSFSNQEAGPSCRILFFFVSNSQ